MDSKFATVPDKPNFPQEEENVLNYWTEIDAFKKQLEMSEGKTPFTFYDGPPFATGLPHYGHIAAGTIKDVVTRYATMKGHHVERKFGWDCHGLPIEFEIDKIHKIKSSVDREALGVSAYNKLCREIVMRYSKEWEKTVNRFGRWIDFENDYKTMDRNYMESVWWTFKQVFDRGLVYRGTKIMPFSTACNTVLSNFEAGSNYKDVPDPAVIVTFPVLEDDQQTNFIAWTTTPWTLPSNLALAVNPTCDYVRWKDDATEKVYICMKDRLDYVLKQGKIKKHAILETFKGEVLVGKRYTPLFGYFEERAADGCFQVLGAPWVTTGTGTGIVHCAPGFGEDDYAACVAAGIIQPGKAPVPIDQDGKFTAKIDAYKGIYIKDADKTIIADLKAAGNLFCSGTVRHSYPFCWRSQTPLVYRGFDCWFIKVTDIKPRLVELNKTTRWVPSFVQEKRFHNWLEDARDWCFSRNRYWGNPIPIWVSDDGEEVVCIGSIEELERLSGCGPLSDIHREYVDQIEIPSKEGRGMLKRIPEVFDCWFESGSMPFAQSHYPFSTNEEKFNSIFPADFIAEGLDQTRGWFYTLMVISGAVKDCAPFKNLIVNGIVLAEDGTKMSKSKQNYPDPLVIANTFGADACRLYLCNSPVVRAETLKFSKDGVQAIVRDIFLPWFNAYRFCIQNITRFEKRTNKPFIYDPQVRHAVFQSENANYLDKYMIASSQHMIKYVRNEMDNYRLYNVVRHLVKFLENLTNWYVRLNRNRMKGDTDVEDQSVALTILFDVLLSATQLMAPITPFMSEFLYQNLRNGLAEGDPLNKQSIHFTEVPTYSDDLIDEEIEATVERMQSAIEVGRLCRSRAIISMKYPLAKVRLVDSDETVLAGYTKLQRYIKDELNCVELEIESNEDSFIQYKLEADNRALGAVFKKKFDKKFKATLASQTNEQIKGLLSSGKIDINGNEVTLEMVKVVKSFTPAIQADKKWVNECKGSANVMLDVQITPELKAKGLSREITNRIQRLRKNSGISIEDEIEIFYEVVGESPQIRLTLDRHLDSIMEATRMPVVQMNERRNLNAPFIGETEFTAPDEDAEQVKMFIYMATPDFVESALQADFGNLKTDQTDFVAVLKSYVNQFDAAALRQKVTENNGTLNLRLDGNSVALVRGTHFYFNIKDRNSFSGN